MTGPPISETNARATAENAARASYGRLLAILAARTGNITFAEDLLSEAFVKALAAWPDTGAPECPEAWLLAVAQRSLIDQKRHDAVRVNAEPEIARLTEQLAEDNGAKDGDTPDKRLGLMMTCAHPAIDPAIRAPLILQCVLGLDAERIGAAFLVPASTMGQRLVRAKRKIEAAKIPFEVPGPELLPDRIDAVLDALYVAFGTDFNDTYHREHRAGLGEEAIYLSSLVCQLAPKHAEAFGLYALMNYVHARSPARNPMETSPTTADMDSEDDQGAESYIPLKDQDASRWDFHRINLADDALGQAAQLDAIGRFQLEAAIQSAHIENKRSQIDTMAAVIHLYDRLIEVSPSTGARIARCAALLNAGKHSEALTDLLALPSKIAQTYQPYWATLGEAYRVNGQPDAARAALARAESLASSKTIKDFLRAKLEQL